MAKIIPVQPRKSPRQSRSRATVDALIEATARILVEGGLAGVTTNRIAEVAGVSVGSLYQYFPNKEALILAVVDRHLERVSALLSGLAAELADVPLEAAVRATIEGLIAAHRLEPALHLALDHQAHHLASSQFHEARARITAIIRAWLHARREEIAPQDLDAAAFVLNIAVESVTHELLVDTDVVPEAVLEELCAMVLGYLQN